MAEVEETIKRLSSHKGVEGIVIVNMEGIPIRTTLDHEKTIQHSALITQLTAKAKSVIRDLDPQNDLTFLRIRSKKHEIMVAPGLYFDCVAESQPTLDIKKSMEEEYDFEQREESKQTRLENQIKAAKQDIMQESEEEPLVFQSKIISERESDYQKQRYGRELEHGTYKELMIKRTLPTEKKAETAPEVAPKRKRRWDLTSPKKDSNEEEWDKESMITSTTNQETPSARTTNVDATPINQQWSETPVQKRSKWENTPSSTPRTPGSVRNRVLTDEELNAMLPPDGYQILEEPASYKPIRTPARKLQETPLQNQNFQMQEDVQTPDIPGVNGLEFFKQEDAQHFSKLMDNKEENELSLDELKERKIMRLLLKIKNGNPPTRKLAMRQITDGARLFGAKSLFEHILPLLMSPTLEDQERHLLVKVIDRVMFKLDDLVRPYCHQILVVIEPMLIDEDMYARIEGREIISNLSKAAGLATMISVMRPDIDHSDEYVRNTTARAFAVVAGALGIPALLPFLKAVCKSKKSWEARHTGIKIVQQISILLGPAVLPHLNNLVLCIEKGLIDENQKVRTVTGLALAALAESASPYGIESFHPVLDTLFHAVYKIRGKNLAAYFKAIGFIIPLFDAQSANVYTHKIMPKLLDMFEAPDPEMQKIVLKVVMQCCATEGVTGSYIRQEILPQFFKNFWTRRMSYDKRNYKQMVSTTVELSTKVGFTEICKVVVEDLKDESEPFRRMVMETLDECCKKLGTTDLDDRLVEVLVDGMLFAFQEQTVDDNVMLNGFGTLVNSLGVRVKQYLPHIVSTILWRLNNKSAKVRQQSADLVAKIAPVMRACGEEKLMGQLGVVLYEYLGEEYPEVLGSILKGLKAIVNVIGMTNMTPPIKDLLPRLTPILKNRHEKVQEHCVDLVGRIADRGAEFVSAREWMRICFELLDMLKAQKKGIRRAAMNSFGYIAKAIGPQDVLATLLNNLKVQERQNRVCTTIAIAIVAETCSPFTVLPALMNEYRVPEMNVQNGCLKAMSFLFEYIGEMGKDYIWAVSTLLEDALMDRDLVHRQTSAATVKHLALGVVGLGCEDAILHMFNLVWPNIFERSPHVVNAVNDALEGCRVCLGPAPILQYCVQGLFHPARKVREIYWRVFNNLYIGNQDSLVAYYPRIENDARNTYERYELDYII